MNDSPTAAATPDFRPAQFHGEHAVTLEADIRYLDVLARELLLGRRLYDCRACLSAKQQRGRVRFGITADQQHALSDLRHHVGEVCEGKTLADASLSIDGDDLRLLGRGTL